MPSKLGILKWTKVGKWSLPCRSSSTVHSTIVDRDGLQSARSIDEVFDAMEKQV